MYKKEAQIRTILDVSQVARQQSSWTILICVSSAFINTQLQQMMYATYSIYFM